MKGIIGKEVADSLQVPLSSLADLLVCSYTFSSLIDSLISFILKSTSFPAKKQLDKPLSYPFGCHVTSRYVITVKLLQHGNQSDRAKWPPGFLYNRGGGTNAINQGSGEGILILRQAFPYLMINSFIL